MAAHPYRWTILAVGVAATGAIAAVRQGLPSLGPTLQEAFGLTLGQVGVVLGAFNAGVLVTLVGWGMLTDRLGERAVLATGLTGAAAALAAAALVPGYTGTVVSLVAAGMLGGSATTGTGRAVMGWFGRRERGYALGIRQMSIPVAGAAASLALPLLAAAFSLRVALLVLAAGCLGGAVVAGVWMREPPPPPPDRPRIAGPAPLRDPRIWRLSAGSALLVCAQACVVSYVVLYLHDARGWSVAAAAAVLAGIQLGGGVLRVFVGRWSDRLERRIAPTRRLGLGAGFGLILAGALAPAPAALDAAVLVIAGMLAMSWNGLSFTAAAEIAGRDRAGTAMSVQNTVLAATVASVTFSFGALVEATSWGASFALFGLAPLAGVLVLGPLVGEEEARGRARAERLRAAA